MVTPWRSEHEEPKSRVAPSVDDASQFPQGDVGAGRAEFDSGRFRIGRRRGGPAGHDPRPPLVRHARCVGNRPIHAQNPGAGGFEDPCPSQDAVKLVLGVDDICGPCQWWDHHKALCTKSLKTYPRDSENSLTSDGNALRVLGIKPGDEIPADQLYRMIQAKVTKKVFAEEVCVACRLVNKCKETYEPKIEAVVKALAGPHA